MTYLRGVSVPGSFFFFFSVLRRIGTVAEVCLALRNLLPLFCHRFIFSHLSQKCERRLLFSSCLSVRMEQLGSHWTDFHEIWHSSIFRKSVQRIQVSLTGTLYEDVLTFVTISR